MSLRALWLSHREQVEVEPTIQADQHLRYKEPAFRARRIDGSFIMIDRKDILFEEEEGMIDELAQILGQHNNPAKHERYAVIMRHFLIKGVPYVKLLQAKLPRKPQQLQLQQSLQLSDVS